MTLKIQAIGKYSFLAVENGETHLDFGSVFVGSTVEKTFTLHNPSAVPAFKLGGSLTLQVPSNFKIRSAEGDPEPYFSISPSSGTIMPGKSINVSGTYGPTAAGYASTDYFEITTLSGNNIRISMSGKGAGPEVTISTSIVNFGDVEMGSYGARGIHMTNNSNCNAFYQVRVGINAR
jgi:hypothetical protein